MGTVSISKDKDADVVYGEYRGERVDVTLSSSYATDGETIDLADVALTEVRDAFVEAGDFAPAAGDQPGYSFVVDTDDPTAPKLLAYDSGGEVSNGTDLSGVTVTVVLLGRS